MKTAQEYAELAAGSVDKALYPTQHGSNLTEAQRQLLMDAASVYIQLAQYQFERGFKS